MKHFIKPSYLERGYKQFPYILKRINPKWHQQIPLHSEELKPLKLDGLYVDKIFYEVLKNYDKACEVLFLRYWASENLIKGHPSDLCLVLNKNRAIHMNKEGKMTESKNIPSGGKLQALDYTFIQMDGEHYTYEL